MKIKTPFSEETDSTPLNKKLEKLLDSLYAWTGEGNLDKLGSAIDKQVSTLGIELPQVLTPTVYQALELPLSDLQEALNGKLFSVKTQGKYTSWTEEPGLTPRFLQKQDFGIVLLEETANLDILIGLSEYAHFVYKKALPDELRRGLEDLISEQEVIVRNAPKFAEIAGFISNSKGFIDLLDELSLDYELDDFSGGAYVSIEDYTNNEDEFAYFFTESQ